MVALPFLCHGSTLCCGTSFHYHTTNALLGEKRRHLCGWAMEESEIKESEDPTEKPADGPLSLDGKVCSVITASVNQTSESQDSCFNKGNTEPQTENMKKEGESPDVNAKTAAINDILDHVQSCSAIFKNQQIGEPELTISDKRSLAEDLLLKNPSNFLTRFGMFMCERHFGYFFTLNKPEVTEHANQIKLALQSDKKLQQKNRRYEALKHLEAEGSYFSEAEMEKREPLLYHQLVGQFLTEKEKFLKNRQSHSNAIPTFSNFLIEKMERDEIVARRKSQQEAENNIDEDMSDEESVNEPPKQDSLPRWGDDWVDAENAEKKKSKKQKKKKKVNLSSEEKALLLEEFKSFMYSKFLNGLEPEFNYDDIDLNPEYDSFQTRSQDAEDKYFDEESCDGSVCTDTGIEDY